MQEPMQNLEHTDSPQTAETSAIPRSVVRLSDALVRIREHLTPHAVLEVRTLYREAGFRGVFKRYGWKVIAGFFAYYLIRDLTLYVLLPYLVAKGLF